MAPPMGVLSIAAVSGVMALCSLILPFLAPPSHIPQSGSDRLKDALVWITSCDMFAIQNLGHSAFLLLFANSWWKSRNPLGLYMCIISSLLLCCTGAVYTLGLLTSSSVHQQTAHELLCISVLLTVVAFVAFVGTSKMAIAAGYGSVFQVIARSSLLSEHAQSDFAVDKQIIKLTRRLQWQVRLQLAIAVIGILSPLFRSNSTFLLEPSGHSALALRAFVESYTLGFHQAFVLAAGFSQAFADSSGNGLVLVVASQTMMVLVYLGAAIAGGDRLFTVPILVIVILTSSTAKALDKNIRDRLTLSASSHDNKEVSNLSNESQPEIRRHTLLSLAISGDTQSTRYRAIVAILAVIFHGVMWQVQCILLIYWQNKVVSTETMHRVVHNNMSSFQNAVNFAMHGIGITCFCAVLALYNRDSWPFLRIAVMAGAFGGGIVSIIQLRQLDRIQTEVVSNTIGNDAYDFKLAKTFLFLRCIAGMTLGIVYSQVQLGKPQYVIHPVARCYDAARGLILGMDRKTKVAIRLYLAATIFLAFILSTTASLAGMEVVGSGIVPDQQDSEYLEYDSWFRWRLIGMPVSYAITFHFFFLMTGFVIHGVVTDYQPSVAIGLCFTFSTSLITFSHMLVSCNSSFELLTQIQQLCYKVAITMFGALSGYLFMHLYHFASSRQAPINYDEKPGNRHNSSEADPLVLHETAVSRTSIPNDEVILGDFWR